MNSNEDVYGKGIREKEMLLYPIFVMKVPLTDNVMFLSLTPWGLFDKIEVKNMRRQL